MLFVYADETGDPGTPFGQHPGSNDYTLGIVMVPEVAWTLALDELMALRRSLRQAFGLPLAAEVKATYLVNNGGWFKGRGLSLNQRRYIFARHLDVVSRFDGHAFAVSVDKRSLMAPSLATVDPRAMAWETLFQRLAKTYQHYQKNAKTPMHLSHDQGEDAAIRKEARKARRYLTSGQAYGNPTVRLPTGWLIDDPVPRLSHESYLIQLADLIAWTASRTLHRPGRKAHKINPGWQRLGSAIFEPANRYAVGRVPGAIPGIVVRN